MSDLNVSTVETPAPDIEPVKDTRTAEQQVADLLSGKTTPEREQPLPEAGREAEPEQTEEPEAEPETEQPAEDEAPKLDYKLEVPLSNGEKITLGELKDHYQQHEQKLIELIDRENRVMSQVAELNELGQYLQLPPEVKEQLAAQQRQHLQAQHGLMLGAIPEWQDAAAFEKGRAAIFALGQEYGVDLSKVADHKVVKMLHDFARLKGAMKTAKASVKPVRQQEPKPVRGVTAQQGNLQAAIDTAKRTRNHADEVRAVDLLLGS